MAATPEHVAFVAKAIIAARNGIAAIAAAGLNAQEYELLVYSDPATGITAEDLAGSALTPQDVGAAMQAIAAVTAALAANNSALLAALVKLARPTTLAIK